MMVNTFCYDFLGELIRLFSEMDIISALCLAAGLSLCIAEIFRPGFGILGGLGFALLAVGAGVRLAYAGDGTLSMLFIMIILVMLILLAFYIVLVVLAKLRTAKEKTEANYDNNNDYYYTLNLEGTAQTIISTSGKAEINGILIDASAQSGEIAAGQKIKVIATDKNQITVCALQENEQ